MQIFPPHIIQVNQNKIDEIDKMIKSIYRLVIYSRHHLADDVLDSYLKGTHSLKELLSLKNAQMEAQSELEAKEYLVHFKLALDFILDEILIENNFEKEIQLFQLLRIASPEAYANHPNRYRSTIVQVGAHICPEPYLVPSLVNELLYKIQSIANPIVRAIYFHHELIRIHPFVDGNGRVTRLAKNWMLMFDLYPPTFMTDVSKKKIYTGTLSDSFKALNTNPSEWNNSTALFFENELDNLIENTKTLYNNLKRTGDKRLN